MSVYYPFDKESITKLEYAFTNSGVILYPTDTLYALGCCLDDALAVDKIYLIKSRSKNAPLLMITDAWEKVIPWVNPISEEALAVFKKLNANPLSIALPSSHKVRKWLNSGGDSLAFRVTSDACVRAILQISGKPLVATSANISFSPGHSLISKIDANISNQVDLVVDCKKNYKKKNIRHLESTVLKYIPPQKLLLIRKGGYNMEQLEKDLPSDWLITI
ncbi:MAG: L-threonylcarbamoyladenylate synthase [SAR324 cluster bacterium]|nr:L-threonylcarbamoyladenylate synthase [SAR324 cluster bacterium]